MSTGHSSSKASKLMIMWVFRVACLCCFVLPLMADSDLDRFENHLASIMDGVNERESIGIYGDFVSLEKTPISERSLSEDPLVRRIDEFFGGHRLRIRFPNDGSSADYFGRALGQKDVGFELRGLIHGASEGRTKLKRIILPLLLAFKLKAAIVLPIVITLIGLIGIKGLGAGVMALLLSGSVALKALLTPSPAAYPARIGYAKPIEVWHRSQEEPQVINQPYRAWSPEFGVEPQFSPYQEIPVRS